MANPDMDLLRRTVSVAALPSRLPASAETRTR